jgi:aspartate/methionine/tyrosine aminotransferase
MRIDLFRMERTQCLYENEVEFNLSESGVRPVGIGELVPELERDAFFALTLKYPHSDGSPVLREGIADFYDGARRENVLVTNGGSEANFTVLWALLDSGDRLAFMIPNYLQGWGLGRAFGDRTDTFRLVERGRGERGCADRWALDVRSLERAVGRRTRVIMVTNPNNPTGSVLTSEEMEVIVDVARRANAWIVSDEVYRGAEVRGGTSPTFWGRYHKVIVTAGLSKAFGMPGLRIGWIVAPEKMIGRLCRYHDYTTLTPTLVSDRLAAVAMRKDKRAALLDRTRAIIRDNLKPVETWIRSHADILDYIPPQAGAIALLKYDLPIGSTALFDRLRTRHSVLITPGSHFGIGRYVRIGYGYDLDLTLRALARVDEALEEIPRARVDRRRRSGYRSRDRLSG